jgi:hypothetical protein
MKAYWESGGIGSRILDFGTRWRRVISFTPRPLYTQRKSPWYPLDRRLGGKEIKFTNCSISCDFVPHHMKLVTAHCLIALDTRHTLFMGAKIDAGVDVRFDKISAPPLHFETY